MSLAQYRTLGRSGLVVSPLALGAMTFGTARWGSDEAGSRAVFDAYLEAGGNFVDTADVYAGGRSEEMVGRFIADGARRHDLVLATKAGFAAGRGPYAGGAGAKHLHTALEGSLRRLATDHVDLYWLHVWDGVTPAEEVLETMSAFVRAGKVRYWGVSNAPAWWCAKLATLAGVRGGPAPIALQFFYSLVNRDVEDEHAPLAADMGMGLVPWSPLAYGFLTGKYDRAAVEREALRAGGDAASPPSANRLDGANPFGDRLFTDRNWAIVEVVRRVARETDRTPAQIALAWVLGRPGVSATLMGVSRVEQLAENVAASGFALAPEHRDALDTVSAPADPRLISALFKPPLRDQAVFGGASVEGWTA